MKNQTSLPETPLHQRWSYLGSDLWREIWSEFKSHFGAPT